VPEGRSTLQLLGGVKTCPYRLRKAGQRLACKAHTGYKQGMVYQHEIQFETTSHGQMRDLTEEVAFIRQVCSFGGTGRLAG
jgi:hypothetical protein